MGIVFGGAGSIIRRVIGDYSLLGSYSSQVGMGDYLMNFNYPIPQYLQPGQQSGTDPLRRRSCSYPCGHEFGAGRGHGSESVRESPVLVSRPDAGSHGSALAANSK